MSNVLGPRLADVLKARPSLEQGDRGGFEAGQEVPSSGGRSQVTGGWSVRWTARSCCVLRKDGGRLSNVLHSGFSPAYHHPLLDRDLTLDVPHVPLPIRLGFFWHCPPLLPPPPTVMSGWFSIACLVSLLSEGPAQPGHSPALLDLFDLGRSGGETCSNLLGRGKHLQGGVG